MTTSSCGCAWSADSTFFFFLAFISIISRFTENKLMFDHCVGQCPSPRKEMMFVTLVNLQLCILSEKIKITSFWRMSIFFKKTFIGNSNSALYSCQLNLLLIFFSSKIFLPRGVETIKSKVIITIILALFSNCSKCFRLIQWKAYLFIVASNTQLLDNGAW